MPALAQASASWRGHTPNPLFWRVTSRPAPSLRCSSSSARSCSSFATRSPSRRMSRLLRTTFVRTSWVGSRWGMPKTLLTTDQTLADKCAYFLAGQSKLNGIFHRNGAPETGGCQQPVPGKDPGSGTESFKAVLVDDAHGTESGNPGTLAACFRRNVRLTNSPSAPAPEPVTRAHPSP